MITLNVTAARGKGNKFSFELCDNDGQPIDINTVYAPSSIKALIDSPEVEAEIPLSYTGSAIEASFGDFDVEEGLYYPKIVLYNADNKDGIVLAGKGFETEIKLSLIL